MLSWVYLPLQLIPVVHHFCARRRLRRARWTQSLPPDPWRYSSNHAVDLGLQTVLSAVSVGGNEEYSRRYRAEGQKEARIAGFQRVERMILGKVGKVSRGQVKQNCRCGVLSRRAAYRDLHFERSLGLPYGDWFGNLSWRLEGKCMKCFRSPRERWEESELDMICTPWMGTPFQSPESPRPPHGVPLPVLIWLGSWSVEQTVCDRSTGR